MVVYLDAVMLAMQIFRLGENGDTYSKLSEKGGKGGNMLK